jgi:hypothetical protein
VPEPIGQAIWLKLREQIERIEHLTGLVPADKLSWDPKLPNSATDLGHLLGHLLDCLAGFCAVFYAAFPESCAGLYELRELPVNHCCSPQETRERLQQYATCLETAFAQCADADLARRIPSVFVPAGESLATLLLGNLEHLISHKYQLFMYLKMLGVPVTSRDIYHWRGTQ